MFVDDEREIGNYIIVTLNYGWRFPDGEYSAEHVRGFDTVQEARDYVHKAEPCHCKECKAKLEEKPMSLEQHYGAYADSNGHIYVLERNVAYGQQKLLTLALAKDRESLVRVIEHTAEPVRLKELPHNPPPGLMRFQVLGFPEEDREQAIWLVRNFHRQIQSCVNEYEAH